MTVVRYGTNKKKMRLQNKICCGVCFVLFVTMIIKSIKINPIKKIFIKINNKNFYVLFLQYIKFLQQVNNLMNERFSIMCIFIE